MFGLFKRRTSDRTPFEEQLRVLTECGIVLSPTVNPETLFLSFPREEYEKAPYRLLLCAMGGEAEDARQAGASGFPSDHIWHLDTECIHGPGDYAAIARRLATLAAGGLPLDHIEDHVDIEGGEAWLSFSVDGQVHKWDAKVEDDWVDPAILSRFAKLLVSRNVGRRFLYIDLGGQDCLLGCASAAQRAALATATGLKVEWLE